MEKKDLFRQRIRLRHLHTFVAVAQQGTLGRAAEILGLSQPALSRTLNELEELTGSKLLERDRLGARLTSAGEQFLLHAVKILDDLNHAGKIFNPEAIAPSHLVRVGALPAAAPGLLPAVIGPFHKQHSLVTLQVAVMNNTMILQGLKSGELDIGIGRMAAPELMTDLNYELLFLESLRLVVRPHHPLLNETMTLSRILEWPTVVSPQGTTPRKNTDALLASLGCRLPFACVETLSASLSRQLTLDYDYVWFVPSGAVKEDLRQGTLTALPVPTPFAAEPIGLLTRTDTPLSAGAQMLVSAIRKAMPDVQGA